MRTLEALKQGFELSIGSWFVVNDERVNKREIHSRPEGSRGNREQSFAILEFFELIEGFLRAKF